MFINIFNINVLMFTDTYKEIDKPSQGTYHEKGSKFISYCYPIYSDSDIKEKIDDIKRIENSANHYCYAYVMYADKSAHKVNDDGEPSSTAGKPILGQINSHELTNILIVVVRYFGGVKLGIPGLIRSYKNAAKDGINNANIITKHIQEIYSLRFKYEQMNNVMMIIKEYKLEIIHRDLNIESNITVKIPKNISDTIVKRLKENYSVIIKYLKTI